MLSQWWLCPVLSPWSMVDVHTWIFNFYCVNILRLKTSNEVLHVMYIHDVCWCITWVMTWWPLDNGVTTHRDRGPGLHPVSTIPHPLATFSLACSGCDSVSGPNTYPLIDMLNVEMLRDLLKKIRSLWTFVGKESRRFDQNRLCFCLKCWLWMRWLLCCNMQKFIAILLLFYIHRIEAVSMFQTRSCTALCIFVFERWKKRPFIQFLITVGLLWPGAVGA